MAKYLIKISYEIGTKKNQQIIDVMAGSIKKARQMAANVVYNDIDPKDRKAFRIKKTEYMRYRQEKPPKLSGNQLHRFKRAERLKKKLDNRSKTV